MLLGSGAAVDPSGAAPLTSTMAVAYSIGDYIDRRSDSRGPTAHLRGYYLARAADEGQASCPAPRAEVRRQVMGKLKWLERQLVDAGSMLDSN